MNVQMCIGCDGTGEISYCGVCRYHESDCKCDGPGGPWMPMPCPNCEGVGFERWEDE
jgi:hypothetical protein